jgi:hypothetical protein
VAVVLILTDAHQRKPARFRNLCQPLDVTLCRFCPIAGPDPSRS